MKKTLHTTALGLTILAASSSANAATIAWGAATNVSTGAGNEADVSTNGTLHHAANGEFSSGTVSDQTVNGVLFTAVGGGNGGSADLWTGGNAAGGDAAYNALLSEANFANVGDSGVISLGGGSGFGGAALTATQQYEIQIWFVDDRSTAADSRTMQFGDTAAGAGNNVSLNDQYVIGTFTADATTQVLYVNTLSPTTGFGQSHISALQIRSVPEPSSTALLGLGGLALILRRSK